MDNWEAALGNAARAQLAAALAGLPPSPKRLYVDDDLFCKATNTCPLLSFFTSPESLQKVHSIVAILPLSSAGTDPYLMKTGTGTSSQAGPAGAVAGGPNDDTSSVSAASTVSGATSSAHSAPAFFPIFLLRPSAGAALDVVKALKVMHPSTPRALALVTPRRSRVVERELKPFVFMGTVRLATLPLSFLPFDDGLATLHWPRAFAEVVLEGNNSALIATATALRALAETLDLEYTTVRSAGKTAAATVQELARGRGRKPGVDKARAARSTSAAEDRAQYPEDDTTSMMSSPRFTPLRAPDMSMESLSLGRDVENSEEWFEGEVTLADVRGVGTADTVRQRKRRKPVTLLVLDRNVDVVTPLLTQWSYEGIIDEALGLLRGNTFDIGADEFVSSDAMTMLGFSRHGDDDSHSERADVRLGRRIQKRLRTDEDPLFGQLRDLNYWAAAEKLESVAKDVQAYYEARPGRETSDLGQVKDYVRGLRDVKIEHRSASVHTAIAAEVSARTFEQAAFKRRFELEREMLEGSSATGRRVVVHDAISRKEPISHVLRLCCLWSVTSGGIDIESFEMLKREIVATYGLSVLSLLGNLERSGLLVHSTRTQSSGGMQWNPFANFGAAQSDRPTAPSERPAWSSSGGQGSSPSQVSSSSVVGYSWQFVRAAMRLMEDFEPDTAAGESESAPYSGYVPLTVRLVEAGISSQGWGKLPRIAAHTYLLPPGHVTAEHAGPSLLEPERTRASDAHGSKDIDAVVVFVGGVLRAEASAIRLMARLAGRNVLIAATDVCGADQFVTMT